MARKKTISKESIINAGLKIVRNEGIERLNARHLAEEMGMTTTPIFTNFGSMKNLTELIWKKAKKECDDYILHCLESSSVFKDFGMRFLKLAVEDPHIYKFVFLLPYSNEKLSSIHRTEFNRIFKPVMEEIRNPFNLSETASSELVHVLIIFTTGLAVSKIVGDDKPSSEDYSFMLSHLFAAIGSYISKQGDKVSYEGYHKRISEAVNDNGSSSY